MRIAILIILILLIPVGIMAIWLWMGWSPLLFALGVGADGVGRLLLSRKKK